MLKIEVFSIPLRERATAIIVTNNHPSKMLLPSFDDRNVARRSRDAGDLLRIKVLSTCNF